MRGGGRRQQDHHQTKVFNDLCSLVLTILGSPSPNSGSMSLSSIETMKQASPAGFASLLLGVSLSLMLCGSVTFVIGFILMPWVVGLVMVFYFVGLVSNLSGLGRTFLCPAKRNEMADRAWKC